ncbi:hypothetical protein [Spiroplasma sp. Moj]|uniref:hypothetical protein n=1 Tax=Spiroplasma sp. Moj TaxID=1922342 RepID=UPI0039EE515D|nr:hypothetical protein [Spiroplasma sp. Moj]
MKKIVNLLSGISLIGSSWPMVNANSSYNPQVQILNRSKRQGNFKALNEEVKNWILGELVDNLPETILKKIYKLNKKIKKNSLKIINVRENVARIIWDEDVDSTTNFTDVYFTVYDSSNSVFYNDNPSLGTCQSLASTSHEETNKNQIGEPIYATVLPKSQRNKQDNVAPLVPPPKLNNLLLNTELGDLPDNLSETIFERVILLNTDIDLDEVVIHDITHDLAIISSNLNSTRYYGRVIVHFTLNNKEVKTIKENKNKQNPNSDDNDSVNKLISKFNKLCSNNEINNLNPKKVLTGNTSSGRLHAGDTYLGTNNGIYLKHGHGQIDKFDDLEFPIIAIELDNKGSAYVLNNTGKIYHLDLYGWGHHQVSKIITNNINLNWKIMGSITNDTKVWEKTINLIKWSDYANSFQEFKEKYKYIEINNVDSSAGGQETTISNIKTNIKFNTENIKENWSSNQNHVSLLKYNYFVFFPFIYVEQKAVLYIKGLWFENEYLKLNLVSYTFSFCAIYHVWTNLKINQVKVY